MINYISIMIKNILLAVAAAQLTKLSAEDLNQDMLNAQAVSDAQQTLADAIQVTTQVYKTADEIVAAITQIMAEDPVFAVLGFVTSFAKLFEQEVQYKEILRQLSEIQA